MSNIILPLDTVDFSATIAEVTPYLTNQLVKLMEVDWSTAYFVLAENSELTATTAALSQLNLTMTNLVYLEIQGGTEHYQATQVNSCIILPLVETGSTIGAYSAPTGAARQPAPLNGYFKEDCTLLESNSLDEPVFTGCELEGAELVYSFQVPEGQEYKALLIFVNENTLPE